MNDKELYKLIQTTNYINSGLDVDYQILEIDNVLYLLFQETRSKQDWRVNFDFPCRLYKKYFLHRGYVKAWQSVKDEVITKVLDLVHNNNYYGVIVSGWSYGASLAVLAAEEYHYKTGRKPLVITFGGAKIAYTLGTRYRLNKTMNITEYTQANDFVTWVAPWCWRLHKLRVGYGFNIKELFNTPYYHTNYDKFI